MPDTSPLTVTLSADVAAAATGASESGAYVEAPFAGTVTAASILATAAMSGANTNSRTVQLHNRGAAGAGTTLVASKAFTSGVNLAADDETMLTLSVTAADLIVAEGDLLEFTSLTVGSGLAAPKFTGQVTFARS